MQYTKDFPKIWNSTLGIITASGHPSQTSECCSHSSVRRFSKGVCLCAISEFVMADLRENKFALNAAWNWGTQQRKRTELPSVTMPWVGRRLSGFLDSNLVNLRLQVVCFVLTVN